MCPSCTNTKRKYLDPSLTKYGHITSLKSLSTRSQTKASELVNRGWFEGRTQTENIVEIPRMHVLGEILVQNILFSVSTCSSWFQITELYQYKPEVMKVAGKFLEQTIEESWIGKNKFLDSGI